MFDQKRFAIRALVAAGLCGAVAYTATAQGRFFGGFGGGVQPDLPLVGQFDKDGDKRLNAAERKAARIYINANGGMLPGRRGLDRERRAAVEPGRPMTPAQVRAYPNAPLYDPGTLRTIFLQFESTDWEDELVDFYHTDVEVPATVVLDGKMYRDVGVHFRGNSSFRTVPKGLKHSLSLSFDFVHEDQHVGGYRTLHLLNGHADPTFLKSVLFAEIARDYIPAPKANFKRVVINGEYWGVYPHVQPFNTELVRDWFKTTAGARWNAPGSPRGRAGLEYLGASPEAYRRTYEIKSKDDPKAWADLINLTKVLNQTPLEKLEAALRPILDVDEVLKFLALDVALGNSDGYWVRASDYDLYQDPSGRFHITPHDFNETFSGSELDPLIGLDDPSRPLRSRLLAVPALRARYLRYVRDIAERWLDWKKLGPIAERHQALIAADVKVDTRKLYSFDAFNPVAPGRDSIRGYAERRRAFLLANTPSR
jgi:hypothetical protein